MKNRWKQLSSKVVHKNPWFSVREDQVLTPAGKRGTYNVILKPPAVFIVAVNAKRHVALIRLYRYPTRQYSLEIPAGGIEKEAPLTAAKRELMEETGLVAKRWKKLGLIQLANGTMNQLGYVYLAAGLTPKTATGQKEEGIEEVRFVPLKKVIHMILNGQITDSLSIAPLLMSAIALKILQPGTKS